MVKPVSNPATMRITASNISTSPSDVEIEIRFQPRDAVLNVVVHLHEEERIERFDDRESKRVCVDEELNPAFC